MASTNFVDYVKINCRSGKGGAGSAHFHRDKTTAKGGPDGGDGGRGGDIILRGSKQLWTLLHLKYRKHVIAKPGGTGSGNLKSGKDGEDMILEVPLGTVAKDAETGEVEFEINPDTSTLIQKAEAKLSEKIGQHTAAIHVLETRKRELIALPSPS